MCVRILFPIPSFFEFPRGGGGGEWCVGVLLPIPSTSDFLGGGGGGGEGGVWNPTFADTAYCCC